MPMNISSNNNLLISTGFSRPRDSRGTSADPQQKQASSPSQANLTLNTAANIASSQRVRPTVHAQPMLDQNLTHRGAQAKDVYQEVELSSEAELMPRLNILA
ncbi:hypothetical protein MNBD_GAMMA21-1912 [hydrothermal vent metagenome]|uniref:Uncharacterized protein n=1 Tax=hydrothermal vent metagenome TaxID=652676 RepID=A0A3B0ZWB2_9ZZZZ